MTILYIVHYIVFGVQCTLYIIRCILYILQCIFVYFTKRNIHSIEGHSSLGCDITCRKLKSISNYCKIRPMVSRLWSMGGDRWSVFDDCWSVWWPVSVSVIGGQSWVITSYYPLPYSISRMVVSCELWFSAIDDQCIVANCQYSGINYRGQRLLFTWSVVRSRWSIDHRNYEWERARIGFAFRPLYNNGPRKH